LIITNQELAITDKVMPLINKPTLTDPVTMEDPSIAINEIISHLKDVDAPMNNNASILDSLISKGSSTVRTYHYPNHKNCCRKQSTHQHQPKQSSSNILGYQYTNPTCFQRYIENHNQRSPYQMLHNIIPKKINLGWIEHSTMQQFCSKLQGSYHLISSTNTTSRVAPEVKEPEAGMKTYLSPCYTSRIKHFLKEEDM
jgi:hypothetical protein